MHFSEEFIYKLIGCFGGFLLGFCLIPQIIKSIKTKSTKDISYCWTIIYSLGLSLLITYSLYFNMWSIYAPAFLELFCIVLLFILKICFENILCCHKKENDENMYDELLV